MDVSKIEKDQQEYHAAAPPTFSARLKRAFGLNRGPSKKEQEEEERRLAAVDHLAYVSALDPETALVAIGSSTQGLTSNEAAERLAKHGKNTLSAFKPVRWWTLLWNSIAHPFNILLLFLAISNLAIPPADFRPFTYLMLMLVFATITRFWQESSSNSAAEKLKSLVSSHCQLIRRPDSSVQGSSTPVNQLDVVPGDIVKLTAGVVFPGDCLIISGRDISVSQSALTGESAPVDKASGAITTSTPLFDRANIALMGTSVTSGIGLAVVIATGDSTYLSFVAKKLAERRPKTAFDKGVNSVSLLLIYMMLVMTPIVILIQGFRGTGDHPWIDALQFGLTVAVGLIPEMLPMILNANLAKGALSLIKRKTIVKQLSAIQNLGAMDVLCSDKTGTLTQDMIVLQESLTPAKTNSWTPLEWASINSHYQSGMQNLLDRAIVEGAQKHFKNPQEILERYTFIDEITFDFERRRMSVILMPKGVSDVHILSCKGAVEEIIACCTHYADNNGLPQPLTDEMKTKFLATVDELNSQGLRVLGVATRRFEKIRTQYLKTDEIDMTFEGYLAFCDPPKEDAAEAIRLLNSRHVQIKVLTGDNLKVSVKVCSDVGISVEHVITGQELELLNDADFAFEVERCTVLAKLSPNMKQRVVQALQKNDHVVGFLGDGINDALALKSADVGISVDSATEVAKEAATVILLEKSLLILERGVVKGRQTYGNTIKYIKMAASSNFGNVFSVVIASIWLPGFQPITPLMLLTNNMIYDISQAAIPWDRMDPSFLERPKRWASRDLLRFMCCIGPLSSIFDCVTFAIGLYYWRWTDPNNNSTVAMFQTSWFFESLLTQTLIIHAVRTEKIPFIQSTATVPVLIMTTALIAVGTAIPYTPLGPLLGMQVFPVLQYGFTACCMLAYFTLVLLVKTVYIKVFKNWL
ncbi:Mg transport ATPase [Polychytrium aggregatum]|uniref:Mg transport ATPase n=1 Tax=Polychytrium aggregatum TaxID=110093 RepID=UPI0022FDF05A|nr:Mg transport ATPase [Polychytrium aggregatum]KAI9206799.1 Mg transport ATPase [Polychytrium aggregatum]